MDLNRAFFWMGLVILVAAIMLFALSLINISFIFAAICMLISASIFIYLGRFHIVQIRHHFKYKNQISKAKRQLEIINYEINRKSLLFKKLESDIKQLELKIKNSR